MAINLQNLIDSKIKGIDSSMFDIEALAIAGAVDVLEKIKTYKQEDLDKFMFEMNVYSGEENLPWTKYNATSLYAWEVISVKRATALSGLGDDPVHNLKWKIAEKRSFSEKEALKDPNSLEFITKEYPVYTIEAWLTGSYNPDDGDNEELAAQANQNNYIVTIFPQVDGIFHAWKIKYIPVFNYAMMGGFYSGYIPAVAVYVAKNIVLSEMNRLLLIEEDLELATELKNHYALLEQEYAGLLNIPPKKEAK